MDKRAVDPKADDDLAKQWDRYFDELEKAGVAPLDLGGLSGPGSSLTVGEDLTPLELLMPARRRVRGEGATGRSQ